MNNLLRQEKFPVGEKINFKEYAPVKAERSESLTLPEMKINFAGGILSANRAAKKLLNDIGIESERQVQLFFLLSFPKYCNAVAVWMLKSAQSNSCTASVPLHLTRRNTSDGTVSAF